MIKHELLMYCNLSVSMHKKSRLCDTLATRFEGISKVRNFAIRLVRLLKTQKAWKYNQSLQM